VNLRVFGNQTIPGQFPDIPGFRDDWFVKRIFLVHGWAGRWEADSFSIGHTTFGGGPDVLHLQYQSFLYQKPWIDSVLAEQRDRGGKNVVTFHDTAIWPDFRWDLVDHAIAHWEGVARYIPLPDSQKSLMPLMIEASPPILGSFGMGRNPHSEVREALARVGARFTWKDPVNGKWLDSAELWEFLRELDGVVLFYPPVDGGGPSSALRFALSARRPVFVSHTNWFADATSPLVHRFHTLEELAEGVKAYFADPMIDTFTPAYVAARHAEIYEKVVSNGSPSIQPLR
jgi:hypothetical protein